MLNCFSRRRFWFTVVEFACNANVFSADCTEVGEARPRLRQCRSMYNMRLNKFVCVAYYTFICHCTQCHHLDNKRTSPLIILPARHAWRKGCKLYFTSTLSLELVGSPSFASQIITKFGELQCLSLLFSFWYKVHAGNWGRLLIFI